MEEGLSKMDNEKPLDAEYIRPEEPPVGFGGLGFGFSGIGLISLLGMSLFERNNTEDIDYEEVKDNLLNEKNK